MKAEFCVGSPVRETPKDAITPGSKISACVICVEELWQAPSSQKIQGVKMICPTCLPTISKDLLLVPRTEQQKREAIAAFGAELAAKAESRYEQARTLGLDATDLRKFLQRIFGGAKGDL
jgi:hypothetical protein